jgi:succinyl-diaminopimelate desuccinylase
MHQDDEATPPEKAVEILRDLVRIPTVNPPGDEAKAVTLVADTLRQAGLEPLITDLGENRANVTARLSGSGERPALLLNGHLDVVPVGNEPWAHEPFGGEVEGGRLYGRGASDMKSGLAAMLIAICEISRTGMPLRGDLVFSAVADEELQGRGATRMVDDGIMGDVGAVVIGEPTGFNLYVAEKGTYWVQIETIGRTAHGSMPHLGHNAIADMCALIGHLERMSLPPAPDRRHGDTTLNIGTINGGAVPNVVPDDCRVELDFRIPPGVPAEEIDSLLRAAMERTQDDRPGMTGRVLLTGRRHAVATSAEDPFVRLAVECCGQILGRRVTPKPTPGYATDASILCHEPAVPFVIVGPGREELAHQPEEHVEIEDYLAAIRLYRHLAVRCLG